MKNAKMSARERIEYLLDEQSFVEIGSLVEARNTDYNLGAKKVQGDGVITGYGLLNGRMVCVYSQDSAALGGSVGEMHARKIVRLYDMAMDMGVSVCRRAGTPSGLSERYLPDRRRRPAGFRRSARSLVPAAGEAR